MVNGEGTGDGPGSEEQSNALDVPSSSTNSLTEAMPDEHNINPSHVEEEHDDGAPTSTESLAEAIPDPTVAQAGEGILADPANVGDGEDPAQLNIIIGGLAAVAAPAPAPAHVLAHPYFDIEYFDIEAGLLGPPLRRSQVGPFF